MESKIEIIVVSSDDEEEPMVDFKMEVILIELSDDESIEETNGKVVQEEPRDVQMNERCEGVNSTRASDSCGGDGL